LVFGEKRRDVVKDQSQGLAHAGINEREVLRGTLQGLKATIERSPMGIANKLWATPDFL